MAFFAFTLGIHWGKRIGAISTAKNSDSPTTAVAPVPERLPDHLELSDPSEVTQKALDQALDQELYHEVKKSGIQADPSRQVHLPKQTKSVNAGATTLHPKRHN